MKDDSRRRIHLVGVRLSDQEKENLEAERKPEERLVETIRRLLSRWIHKERS